MKDLLIKILIISAFCIAFTINIFAQPKVTEFYVDTFNPDSALINLDPLKRSHDIVFNVPAIHVMLNDSTIQILSMKYYENSPINLNQLSYLTGTTIAFSGAGIDAHKQWQIQTADNFLRPVSTEPIGALEDTTDGYTNYLYSNLNFSATVTGSTYPLIAINNATFSNNAPMCFLWNATTEKATFLQLDTNRLKIVLSDDPFTRIVYYPSLYFDGNKKSDTLKAIVSFGKDSDTLLPCLNKMSFDTKTLLPMEYREILAMEGLFYPFNQQYNVQRYSFKDEIDSTYQAICNVDHYIKKTFIFNNKNTLVYDMANIKRRYQRNSEDSLSATYMNIGSIMYLDEETKACTNVANGDSIFQIVPRWFMTDTAFADICGFDAAIQNVDTLGHHIYVYVTSLKKSKHSKIEHLDGITPKGAIFVLCDSTGEIENYKIIDGVSYNYMALSIEQNVFKILSDNTILFAGFEFKDPFTMSDSLPKKVYKYYVAKYDTALNLIWEIRSSELVPYTTVKLSGKFDPSNAEFPYNFDGCAEVKGGILLYGTYNYNELAFLYLNKAMNDDYGLDDSLTVGVIDMQMADNSSLKVNAERGSLDFTCYGSQTGAGSAKVRVCDLLGNEIINSSLQLIDGQTEYVRDNRLVSGVYIISVDNGKIMINKKFMIK